MADESDPRALRIQRTGSARRVRFGGGLGPLALGFLRFLWLDPFSAGVAVQTV